MPSCKHAMLGVLCLALNWLCVLVVSMHRISSSLMALCKSSLVGCQPCVAVMFANCHTRRVCPAAHFLDVLDDNEDVQEVHHNAAEPDDDDDGGDEDAA